MDIENLAKDFFSNRNVCTDPVELSIGEECYVVDTNYIDNENDFYMIVPVVVINIVESRRFPNRKYYYFLAKDSKDDEALNTIIEGDMVYYRILENTSPYIIKVNEEIDLTIPQEDNK